MKFFATKKGQWVAAVLLYSGLILIFMGLKLFPNPGMAIGNHDTRGLFYPWLSFAKEMVLADKLPLWDADQFAGNPFLSNPQIAFFYLPTWLAIILPVNWGISWHITLHLLLAAVGMFIYVRFVSDTWPGAFIAGLIYAFSSFAIARIWAGHIGLLATNAWLPWVLVAGAWAMQRKTIWAAIISGLPWGMAILAGHTSSLFYIVIVWAAFLFFLAATQKAWLLAARQGMIGILIGLALSGVQLLPFFELSQNVARSAANTFDYATAFSMPINQLSTLAVPNFFGDPVNGYWGAPYFEELSFYTGILALLAFVLFFQKPRRIYWFYLALAITGIILVLGANTPIYKLLYDFIPPMRLLRGPGRAGILFVFASAGLLGEILRGVNHQDGSKPNQKTVTWFRIFLSAVLIIGVLTSVYCASLSSNAASAEIARQWQIRAVGAARATGIAFLGLILIWLLLRKPMSRNGRIGAYILLTAVILFDLWGFGYKLVKPEPVAPLPLWQDAKTIIGAGGGRVLPWGVNIFDQNGAGQVGLQSVFGYNTLEPEATIALAASKPDPRSQAYDVLGVGYVLAPVAQEQYGDGERPLALVDHTDHVWVYKRDRIFDQARLVFRTEIIPDQKEALDRIHETDFDPLETVILDQEPACPLPTDAENGGTAEIVSQGHGYWQIDTVSSVSSLLVLSETDYPGWRVTIDGQPGKVLRAYTALRAVCIPAGSHTIIWRFQPTVFIWGGLFSLAAILMIIGAVIKELCPVY